MKSNQAAAQGGEENNKMIKVPKEAESLRDATLLKMAGILYAPHAGSRKMSAPDAVEKAEEILDTLIRDQRVIGENVFAVGEVAATIFATTQPSGWDITSVIAQTLNVVEAFYAAKA